MTALPLLGPEADRTEEWFARRREGVTASEVAALLRISPYESEFALYWRKRGAIGDVPDTDAMSLGRHLEPWTADRFAAAHPELTVERAGLYASASRPWQLATPDRLVFPASDLVTAEIGCCDLHRFGGPAVYGARAACCDPDDCGPCCPDCPTCPTLNPPEPPVAVWEGKTSGSYDGWGPEGTDEIPVHYRAQVLWQMDVMDVETAYVSCLFLHNKKVRHYEIEYHPADVALMREKATAFLNRLEEGIAPPIDGHEATTDALKDLNPKVEDRDQEISFDLTDRYRAAVAAANDAEALKSRVTNEIRDALGNAKRAVHGETVATRSVYDTERIDTKRLRAERPEIAEEYAYTSTTDKIVPRRAA